MAKLNARCHRPAAYPQAIRGNKPHGTLLMLLSDVMQWFPWELRFWSSVLPVRSSTAHNWWPLQSRQLGSLDVVSSAIVSLHGRRGLCLYHDFMNVLVIQIFMWIIIPETHTPPVNLYKKSVQTGPTQAGFHKRIVCMRHGTGGIRYTIPRSDYQISTRLLPLG